MSRHEQNTGNTVLVVDGGGRGAALVDAYAKSDHVDRIIVVPGNSMMQRLTDKPVEIYPTLKTTSTREIVDLALASKASLVDVAQDNAIEQGVTDSLRERGVIVLGPSRAAGQVEWDKGFARELAHEIGIAQPSFQICLNEQEGTDFIDRQTEDSAWFVKAVGLAEGKGALPAENNADAIKQIQEVQRFGSAYVIEPWIKSDDGSPGEEFSTFLLSAGEGFKIIGTAQDHKRAYNGDRGPNTGGMGVSSIPDLLAQTGVDQMVEQMAHGLVQGLADRGRPYNGIMYIGGMIITEKGRKVPKLIEINSRWGDPEAEAIIPGLIGDFYEASLAAARGDISGVSLTRDNLSRVAVAGASRGYPDDYSAAKGKEIFGLNDASRVQGVRLYGAGVRLENGKHFVNGGRLFYLVGKGETVIDARNMAYDAMSRVTVDGNNLHFRTDIGWRDVQRHR